jgi:hypothetical protein
VIESSSKNQMDSGMLSVCMSWYVRLTLYLCSASKCLENNVINPFVHLQNLVDLTGLERMVKIGVEGVRLNEGNILTRVWRILEM